MEYITSVVIYTPINMDKEQGNQKKRAYAEDIINNDISNSYHIPYGICSDYVGRW